MQLILASNSWIRTLLLDQVGIPYTKDVPKVDEDAIEQQYSEPKERVLKLAEIKARIIAKKYEGIDALILGCDSQNLRNGVSYGKPKTREEAFNMIKAASNSRDVQITAYCLINAKTGQQWSGCEELHFEYLAMSDAAINAYLDHAESKAYVCSGGFHIGSTFYLRHCARVSGSNGMFYAIPLEKIIPILQENGMTV